MVKVNPDILLWARETAGFSLEEAAKKILLGNARGKTGTERLAEIESGIIEPSRSLLLRMSEKYRRSLLVFYLKEPPRKADRGQDFRTLPKEGFISQEAWLDALIRDLKTRQNLVKVLLEDEESEPISYIGSTSMEMGVKSLVQNIIKTTSFKLEEFRSKRNGADAFNYLRNCVERSGIFVLLVGDLGSHHTTIPVDVFRGFVISDPIAPFVVVNGHDAKVAWSFTVFHEVTHLWLGATGVSGSVSESNIERFCNEVASEILLPLDELKEFAPLVSMSATQAAEYLTGFAGDRNVSRSMVAYKAYRHDYIKASVWEKLDAQFRQEWIEEKERRKAKNKEINGGPNYYMIRRHHLGALLIDLVNRSMSEGVLTPTKASKMLGVKPRNVEPLLSFTSTRGDV